MLFWDDRKKEKSVHDMVYDRQPEDQEILSYYRFRIHPTQTLLELLLLFIIVIIKKEKI